MTHARRPFVFQLPSRTAEEPFYELRLAAAVSLSRA
jgi:hypothetical protein